MEARERTVLYYQYPNGEQPFQLWRNGIGDKITKAAIDARITRLRAGNFSDSEPIGEGASESKIDHGPGYRIYYGVDGDYIIVIWGGDKSSQDSDIETAKELWKDYKKRKNANANQ